VHVLLSTNVKQLVREEPARVMYLDDDDVVRDLYPELFRHGAVVGAASLAYLVYIEGLSCAKVPTSLTTPNSTAANAPRGT
jgi:hypothetical protein